MIQNQKIALGTISAIIGFIIYSFLVSLLFNFFAKLPLEAATPLSIWEHLGNPSQFTDLQSKLFVAFGAPLLLFIFIASQFQTSYNKKPYGNAQWASESDIKRAKLRSHDGIILGKSSNRFLISSSLTHTLVVAPTRSGKGVGVVIPTLLNWKGSVICLDVKHENYQFTSGFRKKHGQEVFMWSPSKKGKQSHCYNPLDFISREPWEQIGDLKVLTSILIPEKKSVSDFWESEARSFFVGLAIYVIDNDEMPSTIGAINRLMGTEEELGDICRHIVKTYRKKVPTAMVKTLMAFANKAAKERSGVKSTLSNSLNSWDDPSVDSATSKSDFDIKALRKKPVSIYVGITPGQIESQAPLIRIFFEQVIASLSIELPTEEEKHQVLLLLDEFHMLGKMNVMTKAFTLLAGYSTRVLAVTQGITFLDEAYGRNIRNGILSCCAHQIFYSANDLDTANYMSDSCGQTTVEAINSSTNSSTRQKTQTKSYIGRPLLSKDEAKHLPNTQSVIFVESSNPIKATKFDYRDEKAFQSRLLPPPPVPDLDFKDENIPKFNIPNPANANGETIDPNQIDFLNDATTEEDDLLPDIFNDDEKEDDDLLP